MKEFICTVAFRSDLPRPQPQSTVQFQSVDDGITMVLGIVRRYNDDDYDDNVLVESGWVEFGQMGTRIAAISSSLKKILRQIYSSIKYKDISFVLHWTLSIEEVIAVRFLICVYWMCCRQNNIYHSDDSTYVASVIDKLGWGQTTNNTLENFVQHRKPQWRLIYGKVTASLSVKKRTRSCWRRWSLMTSHSKWNQLLSKYYLS